MMARFFFMFCFVLVAINVCESILPVKEDCQAKALNTSKINQLETEIALESWSNDTLEEPCEDRLYLPLCCPIGSFMNLSETDINDCTPVKNSSALNLPPQYDPWTLEELPGHQFRFDDFEVISRNNCADMYWLEPEVDEDDEYKLLGNGSIYLTVVNRTINVTDYCFGAFVNSSVYKVILCTSNNDDHYYDQSSGMVIFMLVMSVISCLSLLVTFVVYSIIPELKNMHGATLRGYVGQFFFTQICWISLDLLPFERLTTTTIFIYLYLLQFSGLAVYFWLNVMCFDIWWTFGRTRSLKSSVGRWKRKKFILYSIYVWGSSLLVTAINVIVVITSDRMPRISFLLGIFCIPMTLTLICNLCFFVLTAKKIMQRKKDMAHHLRGLDSHRHDENLQWFNIYFKLFVVMGIDKSVEVIGWICDYNPSYLWDIVQLVDHLQSILIFVIFVCKVKIWEQLLKRLGCQDSSTTKCCCSSSTREESYSERTKTTTIESDCI